MRLEPIYLLEPRPNPPATSRRRWLAACAALALGGAGAAWLLGRRQTADALNRAPPDPDLAWAIAVANGPIDELVESYRHFVFLVWTRDPIEHELWLGIERLVEFTLADGFDRASQPRLVPQLVQTLESFAPPERLAVRLPELRRRLR
jgi:hypothetical protein